MRGPEAWTGWRGYSMAVALTGAAGLVTLLLRDYLASTPGVVLITATLISTWYGGRGPGLLASLLTTVVIGVYFVDPAGTASLSKLSDLIGLAVFQVTLVLIITLTHKRRESQRELKQRFAQLNTLHRLSEALSRAGSLNEVQAAALANIKETLDADRASILLADEAGVMRFRDWTGLSAAYRAATEGHSPWPPDASDPQPVVVPDVTQAPDLAALRPTIEAEGIRALAFIPLVHAGRLLGKFMLYYDEPRRLSEAELALAQTIAGQIAAATQQRQAAEAVHNERERLQVTLASIGDAVITTDTSGRITFMNGVAQALTEWPLADAQGRPVDEVFRIVSELPGGTVESPVDKVLRHGVLAGLANHTLLLTRSGRRVPIDDSGAPIRGAEGALLGVVVVFRDITERKEAERLVERRTRQQAILAALSQEALAQPNLAALLEQLVVRVAEALEVEFADILESAAEGQALRVVSGVGWHAGVVGKAQAAAEAGTQAGYALQTTDPVVVEDLANEERFAPMPHLAEHGVTSGMTVGIPGTQQPFGLLGVYTSARRAFTPDDAGFLLAAANLIGAAVARTRAEQALRLARDQNAAILDKIAEGVTVQDAQGRLVYVNNIAAQIMGFDSAESVLRTPLPEVLRRFEILDENGRPFPLERLPGRLALQGQSPPSTTVRFRTAGATGDRWSVVSARPVFGTGSNGRVEYAVNVFRDITELKRDEIHQRVLAQAGGVLANSLDYEAQLRDVARSVVPHLGDWCVLHVQDAAAPGRLRLAAIAHADPALAERVRQLQEALADDPVESGPARVMRTGKAELHADVPAILSQAPDTERTRLARQLNLRSAIIVPLSARGRTVGAMSLAWAETSNAYTPADLKVAEELARRVALAADNTHLYAAERAAREAEHTARLAAEAAAANTARLQAVTSAYSEAVTPAQVRQVTLVQGVQALQADGAAFMLVSDDGRKLEVREWVGFEEQSVLPRFPIEADIPASEAVRDGRPIWVESHEDFAKRYPAVAGLRAATGHQSAAYVPLMADGRAVGCLSVSFREARAFRPDERDYLLALTQQCAQALERAWLYEGERAVRENEERARAEAEASRQRLAFLADISSTLSATLDYDSLMQHISYLLVPYLADYASVYILADDLRIANVANAHTVPHKQEVLQALHQLVDVRLDTAHSLIAQVMRTGQPLLMEDFDWRKQYKGAPPAMWRYVEALNPVSGIMVPLTARGRALGVLVLTLSEGERRFTRTDMALAEEVARRAALAADNARLLQEAQRLNAELEQRVQERTSELQASNISLEREVSEREQAQAQLRALTTRLESVREEERTRIAREVHDELGGALTGLKMDVMRLRRHAEAQNAAGVEAQAESMLALLDSTVKTVRRIATDLRPGVLDDFGVVAAIEWQLQDFQNRAGIECSFSSDVEDLPLPPDAATAMFRVFQETLTNVARHAQASRVAVTLQKQDECVLLRVQDNGRGIDDQEVFGTKSLGLLGMRERVHLLAGELTIRGARGTGTLVQVKVPLTRPAKVGDNSFEAR